MLWDDNAVEGYGWRSGCAGEAEALESCDRMSVVLLAGYVGNAKVEKGDEGQSSSPYQWGGEGRKARRRV